jgi:DHA1 family multidrug resistance protein-like MFS transporter
MGRKENNLNFTSDFRVMINNLILNSLGFFFLDFILYYFTSEILNASGLEVGFIFTLHIIGNLISSTFTGFITDLAKSKKRLVLLGSIGRGIAYFILYIALFFTDLIGIYIGYFFLGFFVGFFWVPFNTLIAQKSHKDVRSQAFGKKEAALGKGLMFGAILGFVIFNIAINFTQNPLVIYLAIPIYGLVNFYAGIRFNRIVDENLIISASTDENNHNNNLKTELPKVMILGFILISFVLFLASLNGSLSRPFLNKYLLEVVTNNPLLASFAYIPAGTISMLLAPKLGKMLDRIKPELGISLASVLGAFVTWFLINTQDLITFSILLTLDIAIAQSSGLVVQNILSRMTLKHRGKIFSAFQFFMSIGNILGPILGGIAWDFIGIRAPFLISIIVELCLIPFYILAVLIIKPYLKETYYNVVRKR